MPKVMRKRDGFGEISIQAQRAGKVARNGGHFNRVREPRAQMIAGAVEKNLRLVFEPAERARVDHTVAVALELRAPDGRGFLELASARGIAELRERREDLASELEQIERQILWRPRVASLNCANDARIWRSICSSSVRVRGIKLKFNLARIFQHSPAGRAGCPRQIHTSVENVYPRHKCGNPP